MKRKIVGILVMTLLIATAVIPVVGTINELNELENISTTFSEENAPVWEVGDSWTYACTFYSAAEDDSMYFDMSCDLIFNVIDVTDESYVLEGTSGSLSGKLNLMGLDLKFTKSTTYNADIHMRKSDLGITYHKFTMNGICLPIIGSIPLPIPFMITFTMESELSPEFLITPFPLFDGKEGSTSSFVTQDVKLSLFKIITLYEEIDTTFPLGPYNYECNEDQVTVEAGTFDVYNISLTHGVEDYINYAPEVGNFAKLHVKITHGGTAKVYIIFHLELQSTNYNS